MNSVQKIIIPLSIVIAGGLIATAIYFTQSKPATKPTVADALSQVKGPNAPVNMAPVTSADHIKGNLNAKIVIVDYSDTECPFCKQFHTTISRIFDEYGASNKVAWVYRSFPLDIHKKSPHEAEALECANELGGPDVFWKYTDLVYTTTNSNDSLDPTQLPILAEKAGLDKAKFMTCLDSGKYTAKIKASYDEARKAGGLGTPYTILVINGENIPLVDAQGTGLGALPYSAMKSIIDRNPLRLAVAALSQDLRPVPGGGCRTFKNA